MNTLKTEYDWVLRDVSFTIEPGETVAIVGHTGAGKTTIISLLLRFYDVQKGAIRIDGVDIRDMDLGDLRRRYGVVLQDPFLFSGTVADNIRLGSHWIDDSSIENAAEQVNVADFIRSLPGGFDEEVQERGSTLSTGQKQLISFARALAHNPKILILDEATSSVDTETEFRVREALTRMVEGRTSIIIAHRLSTMQRANKIIVMHKGKVREIGSHQQLLANRGIYWKLYQLQYKDQELAPSANSSCSGGEPKSRRLRRRLARGRLTTRTTNHAERLTPRARFFFVCHHEVAVATEGSALSSFVIPRAAGDLLLFVILSAARSGGVEGPVVPPECS